MTRGKKRHFWPRPPDTVEIGWQHCRSSHRGLLLDDEAVRVAVALRLGLGVCAAHTCRCGSQMDTWGLHAFVCNKAPSRITRHQALNDIITRAFASARIPVAKEPTGLSQ